MGKTSGKTFFISDTHLDDQRPESTGLFLRTLNERVRGADALYLLGDIFEYWIGDDAVSETAVEVARACTTLADAGTRICFMHGNRDFLLAEDYARLASWELLADPTEIDLYGRPAILMHGDSLCTDDKPYQAFRHQVRDPVWQKTFLSHSIAQRINMARQARKESREYTTGADSGIMDVNRQAVLEVFSRFPASTLLIHGHTHRPGRHNLSIQGKACERIVLGDWYRGGWLLEASTTGLELVDLEEIRTTN